MRRCYDLIPRDDTIAYYERSRRRPLASLHERGVNTSRDSLHSSLGSAPVTPMCDPVWFEDSPDDVSSHVAR